VGSRGEEKTDRGEAKYYISARMVRYSASSERGERGKKTDKISKERREKAEGTRTKLHA